MTIEIKDFCALTVSEEIKDLLIQSPMKMEEICAFLPNRHNGAIRRELENLVHHDKVEFSEGLYWLVEKSTRKETLKSDLIDIKESLEILIEKLNSIDEEIDRTATIDEVIISLKRMKAEIEDMIK